MAYIIEAPLEVLRLIINLYKGGGLVKRKYFFVVMVIAALMALPLFMCKKEPAVESTRDTDYVTITKVMKDAQMASVTMSHVKHEQAGVECVVCHHKEGNDDRIKICSKCHMGEGTDKLMHNLCVNCHKEKKKGPADCTACHKQKQ
jgi:hypothetical protein